MRMEALGGRQPAGALVFACNGRGSGMFGIPAHDAEAIASELGGRAGGGLLRGRRDRPGRRRVLPAQLHGHGGGLRAVNLDGRSVLLTGATGGIGQAIARALAGARRAARADRPPGRRARAAGGGAVGARAGVRPRAGGRGRRGCSREVGNADVLVANAALPASGELSSFSVEEIDRALAVNLRAPIVLARALSAGMAARGHGHLVFISSLSGKAASAGGSIYSATKFGLRGFALGLREDLRDTGVGVSTVFPGFISDAGMFHESGAKLPGYVATKTPEQVAAAVVRGDRAQPLRGRRRAARAAAGRRGGGARCPSSAAACSGGSGSARDRRRRWPRASATSASAAAMCSEAPPPSWRSSMRAGRLVARARCARPCARRCRPRG